MRFYPGGTIDSQGRLNISNYNSILAGRTVMIYTTDEDFSLVHIDSYAGKPGVPKCAIRKIDNKGRVCIPKSFVRDAKYALISNDIAGKIVVKFLDEIPG